MSAPIFQASTVQSSDTAESTRQEAEKAVNVDTPGKSKIIDEFMVNTHSINTEILWCMKVFKSHYSYNSCQNFTKILTKMSPDSDIATKISLGKTKCRYMILYRLAPYYKNELIKSINDSIYYSVSFDEALNCVIQKCQMDVNIRHWDSTERKVKTHYFDSQFLQRPNADNFLDSVNVSIAKLKQDAFLHLAMDGPNVNWDVLNKLDNKLVENRFSKTLNIGSCAQHIVHGVFQTGSSNAG